MKKNIVFFCVVTILILLSGCNPDPGKGPIYTVTFNSLGGDGVEAQQISHGKLAARPDNPAKDGYTFTGWYSDPFFLNSWNFQVDRVTAPLTLYARWVDFTALGYRDLISVTGGTFAQDDTDGSSFNHTISGFSLGKYEVTYELWYNVCHWAENNGYLFSFPGKEGHDGTAGAAPSATGHEPVTSINWREVIVWCNAFSELAGYTPCYYTGSREILKNSNDATACDNAVCDWTADGYRLPTEGEWQFAASNKGATPYDYASGASTSISDAAETQKVAWYDANSGLTTRDVGTGEQANALGFWDMSGNVWEWCWDWYGFIPGDSTDYRGPSTGHQRIVRGGGWVTKVWVTQIGLRGVNPPDKGYYDVGFRIGRSNN